jgi:fructose-1,6-bisphosphatase/inositol monophosphatase family enzyme
MSKAGEDMPRVEALPARDELAGLLEKARQLSAETRTLIDQALAGGINPRLKADRTFVTDVDLAVEEHVRSALSGWFPSHGILGEEFEACNPDAEFQWIIDPIDGTRSLRHRVPLFGTVLALHFRGHPVLGVIDLPGLKRCYSGAQGLGAWCNGRRLQVADLAPDDALEQEILSVGERAQFYKAGKADVLEQLYRSHPSVRTYCDCFGHCLALEGSVGAMIDPDLRLWDVAATPVLAREAGCGFHWLRRDEKCRKGGCYDVVFGKPRVVEWVMRLWDGRTSDQ